MEKLNILGLLFIIIVIALIIVGLVMASKSTTTTGGTEDDREIEWRFVFDDADHIKKVRKTLKTMGAKLRVEALMPIMVYNPPVGDAYVRVRHQGDEIALTVKTDQKSEFPIENEVEMEPTQENIDQLDKILRATGHTLKYRVEKVREFWTLPGIKEIVFDSLPGIPMYIEIDAESLDDLERVTKKLGFNPKDRIVYQDFYSYWYGIPKERDIKPGALLTFDDVSQFDGMITKNQDLFDKTIAAQREYNKKFK